MLISIQGLLADVPKLIVVRIDKIKFELIKYINEQYKTDLPIGSFHTIPSQEAKADWVADDVAANQKSFKSIDKISVFSNIGSKFILLRSLNDLS